MNSIAPIIKMQSSLKLTSMTFIGRDQEKKLSTILTYLIDSPEAAQFLHPVDWKQLQLNDYPLVIKHPMNLLKVQEKFKAREYKCVEECLDHIQLVWDNCKEYNQEGYYYNLADKLDRSYKKMIKNYLPNIQIVVPSKSGGTAHQAAHVPIPSTNSSRQQSKSQARVTFSANTNVNQQQSNFEQPHSANEGNDNYQQQPDDIPQNEKNRFHQRLKQLSQQELAQIVMIIQENCSEGFKQYEGGRCQLQLDAIDAETFKKLNERIDEIMDWDKMPTAGSKKVKL